MYPTGPRAVAAFLVHVAFKRTPAKNKKQSSDRTTGRRVGISDFDWPVLVQIQASLGERAPQGLQFPPPPPVPETKTGKGASFTI